ncbi:MAG: hypothetical protein A2086_13775 [Spirochaetes bacterium GWD1_27_9]|nr:MAG: hypothetical protein A2Z98_03355 [Spirochaetes bacterium GWB1_27_13]OHD24697.1 MAG: hypothetical protein A2Y34_10800 [Spirochaetes bacterium GWC1_27_15]OHD36419.1 MAG: hypothetical protein A2086_13775 [Spirochaetes bacterium GWD1_27_9]
MGTKKFIYLIVSFLIVTGLLFSQTTTSVKGWEILYKQARDVKEKKEKVQQMSDIATKEFEKLIYSILQEEVEYALTKNPQEIKYFEEWVYYTILLVGKLEFKNTGNLLKALYIKVENPRYKGEIALVIGKVGATDLIGFLNNELRVYNDLQKNGKIIGKEETVDGLIRALTIFKDYSSFPVLFYASLPNYPENLRLLAINALSKMTDSPSKDCEKVIKNEKNMDVVLEALRFSFESKSPESEKISATKTALFVGLDELVNSDKNTSIETLKNIRDEATFYLGELKAKDPEVIKLIDKKWNTTDKDTNGNLISIEALQKIATEDAAKVLITKLAFLTLKAKEGYGTGFGKDEGEKITIAIIRALGSIGSPIAYDELLKVKNSTNYGKPIIEEANKALEKVKK